MYAYSLMKSTISIQKLRGRPKVGKTPIHALRLPDDLRERVDAWIAAQPEPPLSRSEAIRRLVEKALSQ
jgi:hypothetical protein